MGWKWRHGDVSLHTNGDLAAALGRITAHMTIVAFGNDMFFPPADIEAEARLVARAKFQVIESPWAHFAMFCMADADRRAIDEVFRHLLARR